MSEFQLEDAPSDGTTAIKFTPNNSQYLLASSWDGSLRYKTSYHL